MSKRCSIGSRPEPNTSLTPTAPLISDPNTEYTEQLQGNEGKSGAGLDQPKDVLFSSSPWPVSHMNKDKEMGHEHKSELYLDKPIGLPSHPGSLMSTADSEDRVITSIRASDVARGLGRIPASFYAEVHHSGLQWRTENKCSKVNNDVVEWAGPIPIPSNSRVTISLGIYASFELQQILGKGEELQKFTITVEQLLDSSATGVPFSFPDGGDAVSPCSSILVTVKQRIKNGGSSVSGFISPRISSAGSHDKLEEVTEKGHGALIRYQKHGERRDLERSIDQFELALNICPLDHPCRAVVQSNLARAKFTLCQVDTNISLEDPLQLYRNSLVARPVGHLDRPSTLIQLAAVHLAQFKKRGDEAEITQAVELLNEAMDLSSAESYENRAATLLLRLHAGQRLGGGRADNQSLPQESVASCSSDHNLSDLGLQLLVRFHQFGDLADLQQAIIFLKELVRTTPILDDQHREGLGNLGTALWYRFGQLGDLSDLEDAISRQRETLNLTPHGHPDRPSCLNNLGNSLKDRFERFGEMRDLEEAISRHKDAVDLTADDHPNKILRLSNLGNCYFTRFERLGKLNDLEDAISRYRSAVDLTPRDHPNKPVYLSNFGSSVKVRFDHLGGLSDLEEAISSLRAAVDLTPHGHPDMAARLSSLGNSLRTRFGRLGELIDLEEAISRHRKAVDLTPLRHPSKSIYLSNLGNSIKARFDCTGQLSDLEDAISRHRDAVDLAPHGHPHRPAYLNNLGISFFTRFERLGELADIEEAISKHSDAISLTPHGHPNKPGYLNNLGICFKARFQHLGHLSDLKEAIPRFRKAVDLTPRVHPDKPSYLSDLGNSIQALYERLGERSDIQEAIVKHMDAVDLTPHGHPHKPARLSDLGNCFFIRFKHLGELSDLEEAISRHRDAVDLTPPGHPGKPTRLDNLGVCMTARFDYLGEQGDLSEAILQHKEAVTLTPQSHPAKPACLSNLANCLFTRFKRFGELYDLKEAISKHKEAADLTAHLHPNKPGHLNNLGNSFLACFNRLGEMSDLEEAISNHRDAVDLTPQGHPDKPARLSNFGHSLRARFNRLGAFSDLEEAISRHRDAVDLTPNDHPQSPGYLNNLGNSFVTRFEHLGELRDLEQAIFLYSRAACASIGPITVRFRASRSWISAARHIQHHSLLHAYSVSINLLPQLAWIGLCLSHRYTELTKGADVVREAAAAALDLGLSELAVEWLEQGRSIVWGELFQLRSSYEELSFAHPDYARRLRELSIALEYASTAREKSLNLVLERTRSVGYRGTESLQEEAKRHRAFAIERDKLLKEIRGFSGFERFLLHKEFSYLRTSAHSGPVVILNIAKSRCDALIVLADVDHVIQIRLPNFTFQRSASLQATLKSLLGRACAIGFEKRDGQSAPLDGTDWELFLSPLWKCIVKPVLDASAFSIPGYPSRIFWCPTGPSAFLPIHAAGFYDAEYSQPGHKVFDFVVSSYVPTLTTLTPFPKPDASRRGNLCLLAVRQPLSDGLSRLPGVQKELEYIKEEVKNSPSEGTTLLESSSGTVEEVLELMEQADWVHFACHGIQDCASPTNSGLCLADGRRLKIADVTALSRPPGGLAFLSSCQTAMGDEGLPDEAIHISAGMLFAGYAGVIGTMWSISDSLAPHVARDVYEQLLQHDARPDYREAARALHDAVGSLRDSGASFIEWLPFIHVGL